LGDGDEKAPGLRDLVVNEGDLRGDSGDHPLLRGHDDGAMHRGRIARRMRLMGRRSRAIGGTSRRAELTLVLRESIRPKGDEPVDPAAAPATVRVAEHAVGSARAAGDGIGSQIDGFALSLPAERLVVCVRNYG